MTIVSQIDGLPVFNGKRAIKLTVTKQDISKSDPKKPDNCAVAVACKRAFNVKEVRVHLSRVYMRSNDTNWQRYLTPKDMRAELIAFDRGGTFEPADFVLSPMPPSKATGKQQSKSNARRKVTTNKRKAPAKKWTANVRAHA